MIQTDSRKMLFEISTAKTGERNIILNVKFHTATAIILLYIVSYLILCCGSITLVVYAFYRWKHLY